MENRFVILAQDASLKHVGREYFLVRATFDYSKKRFLSLTPLGVEIASFIRTRRTISEVYEKFPDRDSSKILKYLEHLEAQGYAYIWGERKFDRYQAVSDFQKKEWTDSHSPYGFTFELTSRCNFRCVHCYLDNVHETSDMPLEQVEWVLRTMAEAGMIAVFLSGGEPLLRRDFKDIYVYAKKLGFFVTIFTNGYLLDDELLEIFKVYPPLEIDISLYGSSDEAYKAVTGVDGAFTRISDNLRKYMDAGILVSMKTPVLNIMEDDLDGMKAYSEETGIPWRVTFDLVPTIDNESTDEYALTPEKAARLMKKYSSSYGPTVEKLQEALDPDRHYSLARYRYGCGMGQTSCFVDYQGTVSPCIETRHRGVSIFSRPFGEIWELFRSITYEKLTEKDCSEYKCLSCRMASICKSCPAVRERYYGSAVTVKKHDCEYATALYNQIIEEDLDNE